MRAVKESMPANADPIEEQLLNLLGALWYEGKKVTVLEAMEDMLQPQEHLRRSFRWYKLPSLHGHVGSDFLT